MSDLKTTNTFFFEEFPPISTEEWEAVIKDDLEGNDYKEKLRWHTGEGVQPLAFYRREDLQRLGRSAPITHITNHPWEVREPIYGTTPKEGNQAAHKALDRGADALQLSLRIYDSGKNNLELAGPPLQNQADFTSLMDGIPLDQTPLHIDAGFISPALLGMFWHEIRHQSLSAGDIRGTLCFDPIANRLSGSHPKPGDLSNELSLLASFVRRHLPNIRPLGMDTRIYHHCGASIVQELGFGLASATEILTILTENDFSIDEAAGQLHFTLAVGSNYFLEIAKIRALRLLWKNLLGAFEGNPEKMPAYIHAETSRWNKTVYEPYSNMLRTSTEGMSAVIGGCDALTVLPFDEPIRQPGNFSRRISRNAQIIMREEAHLHKVQDAAAGSYYIEQLTNDLARKAWQLFQSVEERGGMIQAIEDEFVQSSIERSRQKKDQAIATRKRIFTGTNQYPHPDERRTEEQAQPDGTIKLVTTGRNTKSVHPYSIERLCELFAEGATLGDVAGSLISAGTSIKTLQPYRGPKAFEELRLATERHDITPTVLNLPVGDPKIRKARSLFSNNFFGCIGYDIRDPIGFEDLPEAVQTIREQQPDIVVLCSSDKEYKRLVPELCEQLAGIEQFPLLVLTGRPEEEQLQSYQKAGIDLFIHSECNVLETLKNVQQKLNIIKSGR